jgi:NitT/TauT family transport system permease protein/taurine transport system permease protein
MPRRLWLVLISAALVAVWETVVRLSLISPIILAAPSDILLAAEKDAPVFIRALFTTVIEMGVAIVLAWTLGIGFGLIAGSSHRIAQSTAPVLSSIFAIPLIIVYPLLMAWIGIGPFSKIVFGVLAGFFPIALNSIDGVRAIDRNYFLFARSVGATRLETQALIVFPLALPAVLSGLRVGTGLVVIGVIVTEMLASLGGLGYVISYHRTLFDTGHVYFGIVLALLIAIGVNSALTRLDRRLTHWRMRQQAET